MSCAHITFWLQQLLLLLLQHTVGQSSQSVLCCIKNTGILLLQNLTRVRSITRACVLYFCPRWQSPGGGKMGYRMNTLKKILIFYTSTDFKHESNKGKLKKIFFFLIFIYLIIFIYLYLLSVSSPLLSRF